MAAGFAAEFRAVVCSFDLDLLNRIDGWGKNIGLVRSLLSRHPIEQVLVVCRIMS